MTTNPHPRLSSKMQAVQNGLTVPLTDHLRTRITEIGLVHTADELGLSKATLSYWMLKLGLHTHRVVIPRDHQPCPRCHGSGYIPPKA